jgi:hypothetical protein
LRLFVTRRLPRSLLCRETCARIVGLPPQFGKQHISDLIEKRSDIPKMLAALIIAAWPAGTPSPERVTF